MSSNTNVANTATMAPMIATAPATVPAMTTTVPPAPSAVPVTFVPALTPGGASQDPLDYNRPEHVKLYLASTKALDIKYNGKLEHSRTFLSSVERRVEEFGWTTICFIGSRYLFREHGLIGSTDLEVAAMAYTSVGVTRSAQNAQAMYEFLMNSVDLDLTSKLVSCADLYKFGGRCNGPALLKTIISLVQVATSGNATPYYLETVILNLPSKIKDYDSIVEFNSYVRSNLQSLENYGRRFDRILPLLFQAYLSVDDEEFQNFIKFLLIAYDHGLPGCIRDGEQLMRSTDEQYKLQVLRSTWKVPSKTQAQLIALKAQLATKNKSTKGNKDNSGNNNGNSNQKWKPREKQPWQFEEPEEDQPTTVMRDNLTWHWCPHHMFWTRHTPDECRQAKPMAPSNKATIKNPKEKREDQKKDEKRSKLKAKLVDLLFDSDDSDSE